MAENSPNPVLPTESSNPSLEALIEAGRRLSGEINPRDLPAHILEQLAVVVPYERGSLLLKKDETLRIAAQRGFPQDDRTKQLSIPLTEGDVYYQIAATCRPVLIDDVTQSSSWKQVEWLEINHSWLGVPLFSKDYVVGMVSLTRREKAAFSQQDALMASTFALQAAAALENANLYEEITRFNQQLEQMVQQRTEELKKALMSLERLDKNKSDFINVAAHELRTPLTIMKGYLGMIQNDPSLQANSYLQQAISGVLKGTERLHGIINSMLDVVRIDTQVLEISHEPVSILSIIQRVQADYSSHLSERNISMRLACANSLPLIEGDSAMLLKVFQKVIINAIKYTPDGGEITINACHAFDDEQRDCIEITVQDNGIGIDPDQHELIFEKLYSTGKVELHSSGTATFKGGGPGLGLAIARGIVKAHKGRIWVESPGHNEETCPGSTFHILLPIRAML